MICQKCHPVMGHKLVQTGMSHPRSYKCEVCNTYHDDYGNVSENQKVGQASSSSTCPKCGSFNIKWSVMGAICIDCGASWIIK
jgi:hypothetical protein